MNKTIMDITEHIYLYFYVNERKLKNRKLVTPIYFLLLHKKTKDGTGIEFY